jgi:hypothetical protein
MKRTVALVPPLLAFSAAAFAQQGAPIPPELLALQRSDWGCEVLLCLANPNGPTAVSECRPPIERLWRHLARGRSFPTCNLASGPNGRSYASPGYSLYDSCPQGTTEAAQGQTVMLAAPMAASTTPTSYRSGVTTTYAQASTGYGYIGIGDGSTQSPFMSGDSGPPPAKVCVAGFRGTTTMGYGDSTYEVAMYDSIFVQQPQLSPRFIDVYIDNNVWHRVRW